MSPITLCRYNERVELETFDADVGSIQYVAVSHVWGPAEWRKIPGIPSEVLASPHKAQYLAEKLPKVVGDLPFWMDILCVDQRSKAARIGVVKDIPRIYRQAQWTLAIRDGDGARDCCLKSISTFSNWPKSGYGDLLNHIVHGHLTEGLTEAYLNRLWPLEEIFLSDSVRFDSCSQNQPHREEYHPGQWIYRPHLDAEQILDGIHALGYTWLGHGRDTDAASGAHFDRFVEAFLTNGTIVRPPGQLDLQQVSSRDNLLYQMHTNSTRTTGKPRDFVLALMTKYDWYSVPARAGEMSFSELFIDCYEQARAADLGFNCRFVESLQNTSSTGMGKWAASADIPTPQTLGDFLKLMGPATLKDSPLTVGLLANTIPDRALRMPATMPETIAAVEDAMRFSARIWNLSHKGGELSRYGRYPTLKENYPERYQNEGRYGSVGKSADFISSWLLPEAHAILDAIWCGLSLYVEGPDAKSEAFQTKRWLVKHNPPGYKETILYLAALLSCGLPTMAFTWAKPKYLAMTVELGKKTRTLCLMSVPGLRQTSWPIRNPGFYIVARLQRDLLTGRDLYITTEDGSAIGILPDFDAVDGDQAFLPHMRDLHSRLYVQQDGQLGLTELIYVGEDRDGRFHVGVKTLGPVTPWVQNYDTESSTYTRPRWMDNFQVIRANEE